MRLRLRVWLPLVAVLIVLLTIATGLAFGLPAAKARLAEYSEQRASARAAAAADTIEDSGSRELAGTLGPVARTADGALLVVDTRGRIVARSSSELVLRGANEVIEAAANGDRLTREIGEGRAVTVPLIRDGSLQGGVVFVPDGEQEIFRIVSRSDLEAAIVSTVLGGGLMLLVAALLSHRIERLTMEARSLEAGDLSARIQPGYDDELGELARSFNSMASRLEDSFGRLEEERKTRDVVLTNLTEGVLAVDPSGRAIFANPTARDMVGLAEVELPAALPEPWGEFSLTQAVERCARGDAPGEAFAEARIEGAETFLRVRLERVPAFDESTDERESGGVLVVMQDLSDGRRLEASQQRFLANAAHELKTPITTILGTADLLLTEESDDPDLRKRFLERILTEAERMQRLSETLLKLAKTGSDSREPRLEALDPGAVAREAATGIKPLAEKAGVHILVEGSGAPIHGDREWLEQALLTLTSNAIKYSERGGLVRLRVEDAAVIVEDEGEGISESELPYVFERFYRGGGGPGGFGLGLPICRDLVQRMGGEIAISSKQGVGTSLRVELQEAGYRSGNGS